MKNLLDFIVRNLSFIVLVLYVVICMLLLFNNNPYQRYVYFTSANMVSSSVYEGVDGVTSYFGLKDENESLQYENAKLQSEILDLYKRVNAYELIDSADYYADGLMKGDFIMARVVDNSISYAKNFITINKGAKDGVTNEMGVVDHEGVVGIINVVGNGSSRVISLLNMDMRLSCKIKNSDFFGSLVWDGGSIYESVLEELPKHAVFNVGDTIVTSGYSQMFPEGIMVGTVASTQMVRRADFYSIRIKLNNDFSRLGTVRVISNDDFEVLYNTNDKGKK